MDDLAKKLEQEFRRLSALLYDTRVPPSRLEAEVFPFMDENVRFTDPWQEGKGIARYRQGAAGFHAMFSFELAMTQVSVQLHEERGTGPRTGRCLVDGVMHLRQLQPLYTFPLRTLLAYEFTLAEKGAKVPFLIQTHEEMWSFADMIAALPAVGWAYARLFRPGFSRAFLGASRVATRFGRAVQ